MTPSYVTTIETVILEMNRNKTCLTCILTFAGKYDVYMRDADFPVKLTDAEIELLSRANLIRY